MTIAYVRGANNSDSGASTYTFNITQTVGNTTFVAVAIASATATVSSITDNASGSTGVFTLVAQTTNGTSHVELWATKARAAKAATTLTVNFSTSCASVACVGHYSGVLAFGQTNTNTGTSTAPSIAITSVHRSDFNVVGFACARPDGVGSTTGTIRSSTATTGPDMNGAVGDNNSTAMGTITVTGNISASAAWAAVSVECFPTVELRAVYPTDIFRPNYLAANQLYVAPYITTSAASVGVLQGTSAGISTCSATLQGSGKLLGTSTGATTTSSNLVGRGQLTGSSTGASTTSASLKGSGRLAGTSTGAATGSLALKGTARMSGTCTGAASSSSNLTGRGSIAGSCAGASTSSSNLVGKGYVSGTSTGVSTCTASLKGTARMSGTSAGVATCSASAHASAVLSGTSSGASTCSAILKGTGQLSGTVTGTATCSSSLKGRGRLSGTAAGVSTCVASGQLAMRISGTAAGISSASGRLLGIGRLVGTSPGVSTLTGRLVGIGRLSGTSAGISTVVQKVPLVFVDADLLVIDFHKHLVNVIDVTICDSYTADLMPVSAKVQDGETRVTFTADLTLLKTLSE